MAGVLRSCWMIAAWVTTAAPLRAQERSGPQPAVRWLLGGEAAAYRTFNPHGGSFGLGGTIAADWAVHRLVILRTQGRAMRLVETADDTSVCLLRPEGGCWADPVFPDQIWEAQAGALVRLWHAPRLWAVLSAGATAFVGARESPGRTLFDRRSRSRFVWRAGVELALGSSGRAPRVHFTRSAYDRATLDLTGLHTVALLFPF